MFPKVIKLTHLLKLVDVIDGRSVRVNYGSVIVDEYIQHKMHTLMSLVKVFVGSPKGKCEGLLVDGKCRNPVACFSKSSEREPMVVGTLTKVTNFLDVSDTKEGCEFRDMPTGYTESDKMMHAEGDTKNELK
uniref:Uncharacterized protein n=1 Tax=Salix viminalis TaxID=40686 RepID=A0A6N2K1L6_SALVM